MPSKSLRVLVAFTDVSDLLLLRRILRDTPYLVETTRSATTALRALCGHSYAAVLTDDERLPGMPGAKLLAEAANVQPAALRLLLARPERMGALQVGAAAGAFVVIPRPFFAPALRGALLEHAANLATPPRTELAPRRAAPPPPPPPSPPPNSDARRRGDERRRVSEPARSDERRAEERRRNPQIHRVIEPVRSDEPPLVAAPRRWPSARPVDQSRGQNHGQDPDPGFASEVEPPTVNAPPKAPAREGTRVFPAVDDAGTTPHQLDKAAARRRMLLTMVELVEAKSGPSPGHGMRVSALATALGREAGIKEGDLEALAEAALMHDVGELAVVTPLLQRRRRLTPAEQRQVQRHVESGAKIARRAGLSRPVRLVIRHHHERWDGAGYPDGLAGAAIPLGARIIAVVDTWDALATRRPYRDKLPLGECMKILGLLGGAQLDPELVGLFLRRKLAELVDWGEPANPLPSLLDPPWSTLS